MLDRTTAVAWAEALLEFINADPKVAADLLHRGAVDWYPTSRAGWPNIPKEISSFYDKVASEGHGLDNPLPFTVISQKEVMEVQDRARRILTRIAEMQHAPVKRRKKTCMGLRDDLGQWLVSDAVVTNAHMNVVPIEAAIGFDQDGALRLTEVHMRSVDAVVATTLAEMVNSDDPEVTVRFCKGRERKKSGCPNFALNIRKQRPREYCLRPDCQEKRSGARNNYSTEK